MKLKNAIKIIGNILMIIALIFIFKKLWTFDIDYSIVMKKNNFIVLTIITLIYALNMFIACIPWKFILQMISKEQYKFNEVAVIFCKANIMKYIPGNVFQYVGRNEFATKNGISHADVGFATLLEVINTLLGTVICILIFNASGLFYWISNYWNQYIWLIILFIIFIIIAVVIFIFLKEKIMSFINKLVSLINKRNCIIILINLLFSVIQNIANSILFLVILVYVVGGEVTYDKVSIIIGAFLISWLVGFLTIGSPGGIGVREMVMCLLLDGIMTEDVILLSILLFRFITIFGDLFGLIFAKQFNKYKIKQLEKLSE